MNTKQIGIGIIGTGFARKVQIPAFQKCPTARLISVSSASSTRAKDTADEFGIEHHSGDWMETVIHPDVDIVCITTPPNLHFEMAIAAIKAGKHVLAEKPMAMSVSEAREMTEFAEAMGNIALIDHELRFLDGRKKAFDLIRNGDIGEVIHARCDFRAPHRGDPSIAWNWWSDSQQGGGALGAIGSHCIDSLNWLLGGEPLNVSGQLQTHVKERTDSAGIIREVTSDDEVNMLLRYATALGADVTAAISVSMCEYPRYLNRVEIFGTKGAIRIESRGELFIGSTESSDWKEIEVDLGEKIPGVPDTGFARGFLKLAPVLCDALSRGESVVPGAASFREGLSVQKVLDACRISAAEGVTVSLGGQ